MLNAMCQYYDKNRTLANIFLVYFFLTFVIGYLDFDRRVVTFEESTEYLSKIVKGDANPPMRYRVLVPYSLYFLHKISHISLMYIYLFFRFIFYFVAFALFHIYLRKWFDDKLAMIGTLSLIAALPLTLTNWHSVPTDMPNLITFILGSMWIRDKKYALLYFLIPIATFNKETTIALVLLYFLCGFGNEKAHMLLRRTAVYFLLWLIPYAVLLHTFGPKVFPSIFHTFWHNVGGLLQVIKTPNPYNHFYFLLYLYGFYWVLAFREFRKKDMFLRKSVIVVALYFIYVFSVVGAINEVRVFVPFCVYIIPLGLFSLFKEPVQQCKRIHGKA